MKRLDKWLAKQWDDIEMWFSLYAFVTVLLIVAALWRFT
jgi:hypothetical protein